MPPDRPRPVSSVGPVPTDTRSSGTDADGVGGDPPVPAKIGPYEVLRVIGRGGMGVVYECREAALDRTVAVKQMLPGYAGQPQHKARFVREARAQAKVEHDHIIPIYRVGEAGGAPFIAMPLLKGGTLADYLKPGRPPVGEAVRIGREMADGLAAAHAAGLVHRDIKPGNVALDGGRRRVKLLDFGLAKPVVTAGREFVSHSGAVVGTPAYMSPEQARGQAVDARTDLFALGVVLYEMLTGGRPFLAPDLISLMTALALDTPAEPQAVNPAVPAALGRLVMRLLEKKPEDRPADAEAVSAELRAVEGRLSGVQVVGGIGTAADRGFDEPLGGRRPTVALPPATRRRRWGWPAAAVGVALAGGLLALPLLRRGTRGPVADGPAGAAARPDTPTGVPPGVIAPAPDRPSTEDQAAGRPDARGHEPVPGAATVPTAVPPRPDATGRRPSAPPAPAGPFDRLRREAIPPDKLSAAGSPPPELVAILGPGPARAGGFTPLAVSPDGRTVALRAAAGREEVALWDAAAGRTAGFGRVRPPTALRYSPGGGTLAVGCKEGETRLWDVATGKPGRLLSADRYGEAILFAFTPDDRYVAFGRDTRNGAPALHPVADPAAPAVPLADWPAGAKPTALAVHPGGAVLAAAGEAGSAHWVRLFEVPSGRPVRTLSEGGKAIRGLAFARDGRRLFVHRAYTAPVEVLDAEAPGRGAGAFAGHRSTVGTLDLSPDGTRVASYDVSGTLLVWDADTLAVTRTIALGPPHPGPAGTQAVGNGWGVLWAPDGRHLLTRSGDGTVGVVRLAPPP